MMPLHHAATGQKVNLRPLVPNEVGSVAPWLKLHYTSIVCWSPQVRSPLEAEFFQVSKFVTISNTFSYNNVKFYK